MKHLKQFGALMLLIVCISSLTVPASAASASDMPTNINTDGKGYIMFTCSSYKQFDVSIGGNTYRAAGKSLTSKGGGKWLFRAPALDKFTVYKVKVRGRVRNSTGTWSKEVKLLPWYKSIKFEGVYFDSVYKMGSKVEIIQPDIDCPKVKGATVYLEQTRPTKKRINADKVYDTWNKFKWTCSKSTVFAYRLIVSIDGRWIICDTYSRLIPFSVSYVNRDYRPHRSA